MWNFFPAGRTAVSIAASPLTLLAVLLLAGLLLSVLQANSQPTQLPRTAVVLNVRDAISPATSDYTFRGLEHARDSGAALVVLQLDTPGGLDLAMREIIQDILASSVPVIIYVAPPGARAASAGTYMLYAAHVAAMAPGTNLGAATPVQIGGGALPEMKPPHQAEPAGGTGGEPPGKPAASDSMGKKVLNDSIAYIRSLATMRGRNVEWAELAVRDAASLASEEALREGVIDIVAADIDDLMRQAHGRVVNVLGVDRSLDTSNLMLERFDPDWRNRLLAVITNPNVAYILMMIGMYGLFFEFVNPGFVLPGVTGAICLLLALYALQILPVNYAGLGLIILGILFMVGEAFVPSFGALGLGGMVAFVIGSVILFDTHGSDMRIAYPLIGVVSAVTGGFVLIVMRLAYTSFHKPVVSGMEEMVGSVGEAVTAFEQHGRIYIHGESWQARSSSPLQKGERVRVTALEGLTLRVEPLEEKSS